LYHLGRIATLYLLLTILNYVIALDKRKVRLRIRPVIKRLLGLGLLTGDSVVLTSVYGQIINVLCVVFSLLLIVFDRSDFIIPLVRYTLFIYGPLLGNTIMVESEWRNGESLFAKVYPIGTVVMLILGLPYAFPQITFSLTIVIASLIVGTIHYSIKLLRIANLLFELDSWQ